MRETNSPDLSALDSVLRNSEFTSSKLVKSKLSSALKRASKSANIPAVFIDAKQTAKCNLLFTRLSLQIRPGFTLTFPRASIRVSLPLRNDTKLLLALNAISIEMMSRGLREALFKRRTTFWRPSIFSRNHHLELCRRILTTRIKAIGYDGISMSLGDSLSALAFALCGNLLSLAVLGIEIVVGRK